MCLPQFLTVLHYSEVLPAVIPVWRERSVAIINAASRIEFEYVPVNSV